MPAPKSLRNIMLALLATAVGATAQNSPPTVALHEAMPAADGTVAISYTLFDAEEDAADLAYALYFYPDNRLSLADIAWFAVLISDQNDAVHDMGTGTFVETGADGRGTYHWTRTPAAVANTLGYAPIDRILPGSYYLYMVADDGVNEPVVAVSEHPVAISAAPTSIGPTRWGAVKVEVGASQRGR